FGNPVGIGILVGLAALLLICVAVHAYKEGGMKEIKDKSPGFFASFGTGLITGPLAFFIAALCVRMGVTGFGGGGAEGSKS
ncbi:hypothetical protein JYU14_04720, partial [Simkania negevensis]|nr:hypothetical protein [Simkania negevensis]